MLALTREEALAYSKDDLEKLGIVAEIERNEAEAKLFDENRIYQARNNVVSGSKSDSARVYTFYAPVSAESVQKCMEELGNWSRRDPESDIKIVLNSPGGGVLDGLALYDYIRELRARGHNIEVVVLGMAASMGGILLQAGDIRTMGANSWLMIHEVSSGAIGNLSELEDQVVFAKRLQESILAILAERSTMTVTKIKNKWTRQDWWLSAKEALELGFCDRIQS